MLLMHTLHSKCQPRVRAEKALSTHGGHSGLDKPPSPPSQKLVLTLDALLDHPNQDVASMENHTNSKFGLSWLWHGESRNRRGCSGKQSV